MKEATKRKIKDIFNGFMMVLGTAMMFTAVIVAVTAVETPGEPLSLPMVYGIAIVAFLFGNVLRVCAGKDSFFDFIRLRHRV